MTLLGRASSNAVISVAPHQCQAKEVHPATTSSHCQQHWPPAADGPSQCSQQIDSRHSDEQHHQQAIYSYQEPVATNFWAYYFIRLEPC
jgi:hypothetical protein